MLSLLEERRLRQAGAGTAWEKACGAVDEWIAREWALERLTDLGLLTLMRLDPPTGSLVKLI